MKLILKSLGGELTNLEVEPSDTVNILQKILSLKQKYQTLKQIEIGKQKLIYKGQVTDDSKNVENYNMKDGDFIVIMVSQQKAPVQQPQNQVQQQPQVQQQQQQQQIPSQQQVQAPISQPVQNNVQPVNQAQTGILLGEAAENTINEMVNMGFSREQCLAAMKAAFNNPERAIEYLLNGIPQQSLNQPQQQQPVQPNLQPQQQQAPLQQGSQITQEQLQQMLNSPVVQQLRNSIRQNPQILTNPEMFGILLQMIQQQQPQLFQIIQQNPEILQELVLGGAPQQNQIQVTPQQMQEIEQIMELGFTKDDALQAYLVCDRNMEMAISLLFDQADKEQQQIQGQAQSQQQQQNQQQQPQQQQNQNKDQENQKDDDKNKKDDNNKKDGNDKKDDDDSLFS